MRVGHSRLWYETPPYIVYVDIHIEKNGEIFTDYSNKQEPPTRANPHNPPLNGETGALPPKVPPTRVSQWERADTFWGVLFHIPGTRWRVAVCKDGYQWLLQQREAKDHWQNRKHFSNKERLGDVIKELLGTDVYTSVKDKISNLPI